MMVKGSDENKVKSRFITVNDLNRSVTAHMSEDVLTFLNCLRDKKMERMLDIGCGYGGVSMTIAQHLSISEIFGVDIDERVFEEARSKGLIVTKLDAEKEPYPFSNDYFDLITSFGVLEHLSYFDHVFTESFRILKPRGYLLISTPNLASWINRLALLLGYQPRDVEISKKFAVGVSKHYGKYAIGHLHTSTLRALKELLVQYGFKIIATKGCKPYVSRLNPILNLIDTIAAIRPSLARRFFVLSKKPVDAMRAHAFITIL